MEKFDIKRVKKTCDKCGAHKIKFTDKLKKKGEKAASKLVCVFCESPYKEKLEDVPFVSPAIQKSNRYSSVVLGYILARDLIGFIKVFIG